MSGYHEPVLVAEVLEYLVPDGGASGLLFDGTVGGGGHARELLAACEGCRLLAVDRDPDALEEARRRLAEMTDRIRFVRDRFDRALEGQVAKGSLKGALLDLGVSSWQLDSDDRGFSLRESVELDMRMNASERTRTAADLLNTAPREELRRIFREYGEERRAGRLAAEVVRRREREPFTTSDQLNGAVRSALGRVGVKELARIYQALRLAVNEELDALASALPAIRDRLEPGGTAVIISYHSLEDRLVKNAFRDWSRACVCPPDFPICTCRGVALGTTLTRRPVMAGEVEVERNPRARSARLRAWRKAA